MGSKKRDSHSPNGWLECHDAKSGRPFWFEKNTGRSTWNKPSDAIAAVAATREPDLPGWTKHHDAATGHPFWHEVATGRSVWVRPGESITDGVGRCHGGAAESTSSEDDPPVEDEEPSTGEEGAFDGEVGAARDEGKGPVPALSAAQATAAKHGLELVLGTDRSGACQFSAIACAVYGDPTRHDEVRQAVCDELDSHPQRYAQCPELDGNGLPMWEAVPGNNRSYHAFVARMRWRGEYGVDCTLSAAVRIYQRPALVYVVEAGNVLEISRPECEGRPSMHLVLEQDSHYYGAVPRQTDDVASEDSDSLPLVGELHARELGDLSDANTVFDLGLADEGVVMISARWIIRMALGLDLTFKGQNAYGGLSCEFIPAVSCEGWLKRRRRDDGLVSKKRPSRFFVLRGGLLSQYDSPPDTNRLRAVPDGSLNVINATLIRATKGFGIDIRTSKQRWRLFANSEEDQNSWLEALEQHSLGSEAGTFVLPRRQDLPLEAFLSVDTIRTIYERGDEWSVKKFKDHCVPVIAVSSVWLTEEHPDPAGRQLRIVAKALMQGFVLENDSGRPIGFANAAGFRDMGVLWDWGSFHTEQDGGPLAEHHAYFKRAFHTKMDLWFSHSKITKFLVTSLPRDNIPDDVITYDEDGWCFFERSVAQLCTPLKMAGSYWPMIAELGSGGEPPTRSVPLAPVDFGVEIAVRALPSDLDYQVASVLYKRAVDRILGNAAKLDLYETALNDLSVVAQLCTVLRTYPISVVYLSKCRITDQGARAISRVLATSTNLEQLDLRVNSIGDDGAEAIAAALASNTVLRYLGLDTNLIADRGAEQIGAALTQNASLQYLGFDSNSIGDRGAQKIGEALETNTTLQFLDLDNNFIGDDGAVAIGVALTTNSSLKKLYLWGNSIGDEGASVIAEALKTNVTLQWLELWSDCIDVKIGEKIKARMRGRER